MEIITCRKCGKMFQYITGVPLCPKCRLKEEEIFQIVKAYLRENKGATMPEVSKATGASMAMIERYLKEGRLEVTPGSPIALSCEGCGAQIRTGRLCDKCRSNLSKDFSDAAQNMMSSQKDNKVKERMRFFNSNNN